MICFPCIQLLYFPPLLISLILSFNVSVIFFRAFAIPNVGGPMLVLPYWTAFQWYSGGGRERPCEKSDFLVEKMISQRNNLHKPILWLRPLSVCSINLCKSFLCPLWSSLAIINGAGLMVIQNKLKSRLPVKKGFLLFDVQAGILSMLGCRSGLSKRKQTVLCLPPRASRLPLPESPCLSHF